MTMPGKLSFSMKRRRVLIYKSTLRLLGMPSNIRFLLNKEGKRLAVQACEAIDRDSFEVPDMQADDHFEISSVNFISVIYRLAKWNTEQNYRMTGVYFKSNRLVEFALDEAETISEEQFILEETVEDGFYG